MFRIRSIFLLLLLSLPIHTFAPFAQEAAPPQNPPPVLLPVLMPVLFEDILGPLKDTEFIELTPVDLEHINTGFRHSINSNLNTLGLIDAWDPLPQYQAVIELLKVQTRGLSALVKVRTEETSAQFMQRLLKMHEVADEIFSIVSRIKFQDQADAVRLQESAAHISNLLNFSLRVFQKKNALLSAKTLENVEALVELAKGGTIYTRVNHQGEILPAEVISHLDLFMPREEFMARLTLFTLLADFVSDPNNQFSQPRILIQEGTFVMILPYCLTLFGSAEGREPWDRGGPGLVTYLFKIFYEKNLGAKISTTQDFRNKLLEIRLEVPLSGFLQETASPLEEALTRLEAQMYLRRSGSLAENYIFLDSTAHEISDRLSQFRGEISPEVLRKTVTDVLERHVREPEHAIDMDLLVDHLCRWGAQEETPWSLKNVSFIARHLQESVLREAKRASK